MPEGSLPDTVQAYHNLSALIRLAFDHAQARRAYARAQQAVYSDRDDEDEGVGAALEQQDADAHLDTMLFERACELLGARVPETYPTEPYRCPECHSEIEVRVVQAVTADPNCGTVSEEFLVDSATTELRCHENEHDCSLWFGYDSEKRSLLARQELADRWDRIVKGIWRELRHLGADPRETVAV